MLPFNGMTTGTSNAVTFSKLFQPEKDSALCCDGGRICINYGIVRRHSARLGRGRRDIIAACAISRQHVGAGALTRPAELSSAEL